ncbi:nucleotide-diphospho-sugar transferase [Neoconidiobolus thromboides FSU 785]|nr:nucleotide-diphospho-sugar transferase [Neoconidiobolus thromboides FSU 785]
MATKSSNKGGRKDSKDKSSLNQEEDVLQAVVLADSFDSRFKPLTFDTPRCLLPLCNIPLIEYTLEMLVLSNVKDIYILCCAHSDKIKEYIRNSKWGKSSNAKVTVIVTQQLLSVGDALRDIDSKSIIRSDFILLSGDIVSNMKLQEAVNAHKARRLKNKDIIMTMLVKEASLDHPARYPEINPIYMLDSNSKECYYFETQDAYPSAKSVSINPEILSKVKNNEFELRKDLVDCYVDICSEEVPALFTENFDYQDLRKDFVHGILTSDLLGKSIYCHVVEDAYASKVSGTKMYDTISKDVIKRWTYPLVPDANLTDTTYNYGRQQVYKERDVVLANSCQVERRTVIGEGSSIGSETKVRDSVIGRNCSIDNNVELNGAYLFDDVIVEDNCVINNAIIGKGVKVLKGSKVSKGCIIAPNCVIGPNITLPEKTKVSSSKIMSEFDSDDEESNENEEGITYGQLAYKYVDIFSDDEDEDEENPSYVRSNFDLTQLGVELKDLPALPKVEDQLTENENEDNESDDGSDDGLNEEEKRDMEFEREAKSTVERALKEGLTLDNAALELTALRMSYNAQFIQVRECLIPQLLEHLDPARTLAGGLKSIFSKWAPLISKFTISEYDMIDAIDILMLACSDHSNNNKSKMFALSLKNWYDLDVVTEEALIEWYEGDDPDRLSERMKEYKELRAAAKPLIDWLNEAEEEDSD